MHHLVKANIADKKVGSGKNALEPRTGVFRWKMSNQDHWMQTKVGLSLIIVTRMRERRTGDKLPVNVSYIDHIFTTTLMSKEYEDSPFRLVKHVPVGTSDVPINYTLEAVDEISTGVWDEDLEATVGYVNGWRSANKLIRYQKRKTRKMLCELTDWTRETMVEPELIEIPVKG